MGRRKKEETVIEEKTIGWVDGAMPKPASSLPTAPDPKPTPKAEDTDPVIDDKKVIEKIEKKEKGKKAKDGFYPIPENYKGHSFIEALNILKVESSFAARKAIAKANGIENYLGLGKDNKQMLDLLMAGNLKK